jgi:acetoin utilization deacetylase AcuC-like enzyme
MQIEALWVGWNRSERQASNQDRAYCMPDPGGHHARNRRH